MGALAFNPNRLKAARIYRGLTITDLAAEIDVTKQMVSQYENGKSVPGIDTLFKIITVLKFPRDFFYKGNFNAAVENTFFRASSTATKKSLKMQEVHSLLITEIYDVLEEYVDFPKLNLPQKISDNPEEAAIQLREFWGLGMEPIDNIIYELEQNGVIVTSYESNQFKIDAYCQHQLINGLDRFVVVLTNDKQSFARRQFNAAHELGHICLHKENLVVDELSTEEFAQMENEANEFAAAFLLPKNAFLSDLHYPNKLEYYIELKKKWKVSIQMMIIRARNLDAINYNQYQYLMRKVSALGWKQKEPLDEVFVMRKPQAFNSALELIIYNDVLQSSQFINYLSIDKEDIEKAIDIDSNILSYARNIEDNLVTLSNTRRDLMSK